MKKISKEIFMSIVVAIIVTITLTLWLLWPSFSSASTTDENTHIPETKTVCITHTVVTGESVTSIAKKVIEENHLDINPDVFASAICADNNISANDFIHEGDVLRISFSVKEETGN